MEQMYYVQDTRSYVGNSPVWWDIGGNGYVCNLDKAGLYTYEQAMKQFNVRSTDVPWKQQDVESAVKRIVDPQCLIKSNKDGFYSALDTRLEEIQEQKRIDTIEAAKVGMQQELEQELEWILDSINFDNVSNIDDFYVEFQKNIEHNSNIDFSEYYYPHTHTLSPDDIYIQMLEHNVIHICSRCNTPTNLLDAEYTTMCVTCGEEQWLVDNPD